MVFLVCIRRNYYRKTIISSEKVLILTEIQNLAYMKKKKKKKKKTYWTVSRRGLKRIKINVYNLSRE